MQKKSLVTSAAAPIAIVLLAWVSASAAENPPSSAQIETPFLRFTLSLSNGACELLDKDAGVTWRSDPQNPRFGEATLDNHETSSRIDLSKCEAIEDGEGMVVLFHFLPAEPEAALRVWIRPQPDQRTLNITYQPDHGVEVSSITLLADLLTVTDSAKGYVVLPVREGLLVPADSGQQFSRRFDSYAYEGCHMAMFGAVQQGAAALVSWEDPYAAVGLKSSVAVGGPKGNRQRLTPSLVLTKSARHFRLSLLGKGDHVSIAKAYRKTAADRGWLVTWDEKLKTHPKAAGLFGAANIKLWSALDRRMNAESTKEESVRVNWTFDEAAQVAEHLKNDLKLDRVLFTVGGWIHRGYDNQHPDILPMAPECGGDQAFSACAKRVMQLGYLFCLHDNYQDIYHDSPSWDERFIMKTADNKLARGGHWAGGMAYLTCSQMALELAKRPQNLPAVKTLSDADAYFIDTTYASGLQECFDPAHPLSRRDDMKWKQELSDYAREVFGVFGSECGREWAIPHSDFFEGLTGVSGRDYHDAKLEANLGATTVPLFEIVYRDCIAMYGKYGYDPYRAGAYVLHHISLARPLNYHSIPAHCYWKQTSNQEHSLALRPGVPEFQQTAPHAFQIKYHWNVEKTPLTNWNVFVHFTDTAGNIKFQNDHDPSPATSKWPLGKAFDGPFQVTVPEGLTGDFNVRIGLFQPANGQRASLQGEGHDDRSYPIGKLIVAAEKIDYQPLNDLSSGAVGDPALFTRADNGWGAQLHPMDRFIKNTCEILCPLNELTARMRMTAHEFLTPDRSVQRTVFGEGASAVVVIVNAGNKTFSCSAQLSPRVELPPYGFLVESPTFIAFHASSWGGMRYDAPPMFTLQSLDHQPIITSKKVRAFHAFGSEQIRMGTTTRTVRTESMF